MKKLIIFLNVCDVKEIAKFKITGIFLASDSSPKLKMPS